ncbi:Integrin alpha beta-propellor repeat protein (plasmid) [Herpetosiphon aurantiacus DSM 785]|uniref:Integrin alpha beta-propellor repeat protein n=1 Tax=Herpetosiphon aurantiacus (strain ATCC 23779 / DSM 785 / 114-95) TaxID=316274 RepID=A9B8V6_HERA2|nr:Integrin alpha beta-propellor repeat protein [Herpetosiphon aurantiacus DSM 785]
MHVHFIKKRNPMVLVVVFIGIWLLTMMPPTRHTAAIPHGLTTHDWQILTSFFPPTQQAFFKASNTGPQDFFGSRVAVDDDTVVITAPQEDSSTTGVNSTPNEEASESGAAYVFVRTNGLWTQQAYLKPSNTSPGDAFGESVAIDQDTIVIGAFKEDSSTTGVNSMPNEEALNAGAAYVFVRTNGLWTQQAYLKASNTDADDAFGTAVSVSQDSIVVSAINEDSSTTGVNSTPNEEALNAGAAYVFVRTNELWTQQAYFKASNTGADDMFGRSVALYATTLVVGAYLEDSNTRGVNNPPNEAAPDAGAAYVFERVNGHWVQQAYLKASNPGETDRFGISVALESSTIVVGAYLEDSSTAGGQSDPNEQAPDAGAAYVFVRIMDTWYPQAYLKASNIDAGDRFGASVAVHGDLLLIGAYLEASSSSGIDSIPNNDAPGAGAAYLFLRTNHRWTQQSYLKASNTGLNDTFGIRGALYQGTIVIGAYQEDSSTVGVNPPSNEEASDSGAAYVYTTTMLVPNPHRAYLPWAGRE